MDHNLLRQFVAAANHLHFAHAAKALGVPKSSITVTSGETSRMKTLAVVGDGPTLIAALSKNTPT